MKEDSFFSINHLVEFGIGVNVASQMIKMMNESIQQMYTPGADNVMNHQDELYYAIIDGNQAGPFSNSDVARLITEKKITASTYMWKPGIPSWRPVTEMPDILRIVALTPPSFEK